MATTTTDNTLYYGDNLDILREHIPTASVDLVYLDPPFNSNRNYNVLFKDESGQDSEAQITAFEDTWHWGPDAEATYHALVTEGDARIATMIGAMRTFIGANQMMAYLVMMTARLVELHRVLRDVGNLRYPNRSRLLLVQTDERCCARGKTWDDGPDRVDENILDRHSPDAAGQRPPPLCGTDGARMRAGWSTAGRTRVGLESRDDPHRRS